MKAAARGGRPAAASSLPGVEAASLAAFLLAGFALQLFWMDRSLGLYDESSMLVGADRLLQGAVSFRDDWSIYPPGAYASIAAAFEVFGESAIVARILDALVKTSIVALTFATIRDHGRTPIAFASAALVLALLVHLRNYGVPLFGAIALTLAALRSLHLADERASRPFAACAGAAAALALVYRQDFGVYALVACGTLLVARRFAGRGGAAGHDGIAQGFAAGWAVVVLPVALYFVAQVPPGELWSSLVEVPFLVYPAVRSLPFQSPLDAWRDGGAGRTGALFAAGVVYVPIVVAAIVVVVETARAAGERRSGRPASSSTLAFRALIVLHVCFIAKGWVRVSTLQMGAALVTSVMLAAIAAARARAAFAHRAVLGLVVAALLVLPAKPLARLLRAFPESRDDVQPDAQWGPAAMRLCARGDVPRLRCLALDPDRLEVVRYLLAHGSRGQRLYVGAGRHDKLFVYDAAIYFAAEGIVATRWHDLHPGVQTTAEVQQQMIGELAAAPPRFVVLDTRWDDATEPNASARSSGVHSLDDFIAQRFVAVFRRGELTVLVPRSADAP